MGYYVEWNIEGEKQLSRKLKIMSERVSDWTPAFRETAYTLKDLFSNDVFQTQGGVINERWSPLSRAYALKKAKRYPEKGPLEATGNMRNGFMTLWKPDMAQVWNRMEYFKYHQSNKPRYVLPRRVMMKLGNKQRQMVVKIFQGYFKSSI